MRNAVHRRQHRERNQLPGREKWGILEKHKVPTYLPTYPPTYPILLSSSYNMITSILTKMNKRTTPSAQKTTIKRKPNSPDSKKKPETATPMNSPSA